MATSQQVPHLAVPGANTPSPPGVRPGLARDKTRTVTSQRLPPPTLFQGPPSKNASHISLALPGETHKDQNEGRTPRPSRIPPASSFSGPSSGLRQPPIQADDFRAESLWTEMQKTLADVELSAMNPSHVFGAEHAKALEDLRTAQLSLAQAWAKSEADEIVDHDLDNDDADNIVSAGLTASTSPGRGGKLGSASGKDGAGTQSKNLEEETERDIRLARKRREANDRYFQQVNHGVLEVVSKLDEVASAMRRVEKESRDLWEEGDSDGDGDGSVVTGTGDELESRSPESPENPMEKRRR